MVATLKSRKAPQSDIEQVMAKIDALRAASRSASPVSVGDDEEGEEGDPAAAVVSEEGVELLKQDNAKDGALENGSDGPQAEEEQDEGDGKDSGSDQV